VFFDDLVSSQLSVLGQSVSVRYGFRGNSSVFNIATLAR
jgi:hypothetical protein